MPPRAPPPSGGAAARIAPVASHVQTIGVRRGAPGQSGQPVEVLTNHFRVKIPTAIISHYDVILPAEKTLPIRMNMELISALQTRVAPQVFTPRAVYDGRKNMFAAKELKFAGGARSQEFEVTLEDPKNKGPPKGKGPKVYKIRLAKVAEINPEVLSRFLKGQQSHDNAVLTAITALNVVIRMEPTLKYPFNVRSFFTDRETKDIGSGLILWRGYFQSIRPARDTMLINVDISTGTMYRPGLLLDLCLQYLRKPGRPEIRPDQLAPRSGFPERERLKLQRFISGIRIVTNQPDESGRMSQTPRVVKKVTKAGSSDLSFQLREGGTMTVADYFTKTYNRRLKFPHIPCIEVGSGALLPLEICDVPAGQIMRKQVPPELTKSVLDFATKQPAERLKSINNGLSVLAYGQSEYLRQFGLEVTSNTALKIKSRVLPPPVLRFGQGSRQATVTPRDGAWNMVDKRFFQPAEVSGWVVVVYEIQSRFTMANAKDMIGGLIQACNEVGIRGLDETPVIRWENGQGVIGDQLRAAGSELKAKQKRLPSLIVAVLPEAGADIYAAIKYFGDCTTGVTTQCLKSSKCFRAKNLYYSNVSLKLNAKLGGVNMVPDPRSVPFLADPHAPTIVMGADVVHPAPNSDGKPSFTSVVGNVDAQSSKYIATTRVQTSRQEMIDDLDDMCQHILRMYGKYRANVEKKSPYPKRIIFYRDGVSEGQFRAVLDEEVPRIKAACKAVGMQEMPKLTVVVVGKRHHVRFFPTSQQNADKSGNCRAGTVVDTDISHPVEFDFYLQSHGGLLGTSRPAHYSVLLDENGFTSDALQQLSFALCHVYARSTRSVSIPAPVYYADIVCARAKNHYAPKSIQLEETYGDTPTKQTTLEDFKAQFKPLHSQAALRMYFV